MQNNNTKTRLLWVLGTAIALAVSFLLCRYAFFAFHGNRQWSVFMLIIALVVAGIATLFDGRKIMGGTVVGYMGGFALGLLLGVDGFDPGGGGTNNWWILWTFSFFVILTASVIWEVVGRVVVKK